MPAIARSTDTVTCLALTHLPCTISTEITEDATNGDACSVFANGLGVACIGDPIDDHTKRLTILVPLPCIPDIGQTVNAGSGTVFVGGIGVSRVGDRADTTGLITEGSPDVFAGG